MKKSLFILVALFGGSVFAAAPTELDQYNVTWNTPSKDASGAMPLGNGEVGISLWVEENGDLLFYVSRSDAWSEACRLLKLGRVRVKLDPNPFAKGTPFRQELKLREGRAEIMAGAKGQEVTLHVFVDANHPAIHVTGTSAAPVTVIATAETWRTQRRRLTGDELASSWTMQAAPNPIEVWESADVVPGNLPEAAVFYHRNESSIVPLTLKHQGLESVAKLAPEPLADRTFGLWLTAPGFSKEGTTSLRTAKPIKQFAVKIVALTAQTKTANDWLAQAGKLAGTAPHAVQAETETAAWWGKFWDRSWIFVNGDQATGVPKNQHPLRVGADQHDGNRFRGEIASPLIFDHSINQDQLNVKQPAPLAKPPANLELPKAGLEKGFSLVAWIKPASGETGRIFDKITPGGSDGFLFDTEPGLSLRFIVGNSSLVAPHCLKADQWQQVAASFDAKTGVRRIYRDGKEVATTAGEGDTSRSTVTQAYQLQRWVTACGGRGNYPIKFNGGIFTTEPRFVNGKTHNADYRQWGDCFWYQNTRHMYLPMPMAGDTDCMAAFFSLYEQVRPLAEARSKLWYGAEGAYFPETMSIFGTYSNNDYGWDRTGRQPGEVLCPWWCYAWNQGPELVMAMLDYYDWTGDEVFVQEKLMPMAESVLRYFDTRFKRDAKGILVISPTQSLETYWQGVINDTPCVAGLRTITSRLNALPKRLGTKTQRDFFRRMQAACPPLPFEERTIGGSKVRVLAPAEKYNPQRSNVENPELYPIWPFRICGVGRPDLEAARLAYLHRPTHTENGWGYDGIAAATLGLTDEAVRILIGKCRNSNRAYRFPAMWGPNFDWLPDQNHGGTMMSIVQNMLMQPVEGKILLLPAWPKGWDVRFKLHAPQQTTVECVYRHGKIEKLEVLPKERRKDVVLPEESGR